MRLREVSQQTGISKRTIHFYIKEGLLSPSADPQNGYYDFSGEDCRCLCLVRELRNAGLPVSVIRSLLKKPLTAGYYLNIHAMELEREKHRLEQTIKSMTKILDALPIHPNFDKLCELVMEAEIPSSADVSLSSGHFDSRSNLVVNLYLWSPFLPETEFTDYQEFLWLKINRISEKRSDEDYKKIFKFICSLNQASIDATFNAHSQRYSVIASLEESQLQHFAEDMIEQILKIPEDPKLVLSWKKTYSCYIGPNTRIYSSDLSLIMAELSPFFDSYRNNINKACQIVYDWFISEIGQPHLLRLQSSLDGYLDIEHCNHGELEALASVRLIKEYKN